MIGSWPVLFSSHVVDQIKGWNTKQNEVLPCDIVCSEVNKIRHNVNSKTLCIQGSFAGYNYAQRNLSESQKLNRQKTGRMDVPFQLILKWISEGIFWAAISHIRETEQLSGNE